MNFNVSKFGLLPLINQKCHQATDADIIRQIQVSAIAIASVTKQRMPTLYCRFKFQLLLSKLLLPINCL